MELRLNEPICFSFPFLKSKNMARTGISEHTLLTDKIMLNLTKIFLKTQHESPFLVHHVAAMESKQPWCWREKQKEALPQATEGVPWALSLQKADF